MKTFQAAFVLFLFWIVLTTSWHPADLAVGAFLSVFLAAWSVRFLWPVGAPVLSPRQALALLLYLFTLIRTIVAAALQVARMVLDPRLPVDPVIITHRTSLTREVSRTAFANSLTLTPGTLSVDLEGDTFVVHCLEPRFGDPVRSGELERRVARVFEEQ